MRWKMKFLECEAHIIVDGEELPEYGIEYDGETKTAVCWVPSQAGKSFSITGIPPKQSDIDVAIYFHTDGGFVGGNVFHKGRPWAPTSRSHVDTSATTSRPLMFASIELTDDDTLLNSANPKNLGEITLRIYHVEIKSENNPFKELAMSRLTNNQIHQRSKKAVTHKINLGPEVEQPAKTYTSCDSREMLCNLTFKYRSIDVLRANGIAPPSSIPPTDGKRKASEDDDGEDDDGKEQDSTEDDQEEEQDQAQLKTLLEQVKALEAKMTKARKTEHRPVFIPGEVIDLTL
ncbi:hypothetical protein H2248_008177 [Termitomyces sp. 'cryptogamus']|nr:hypothetical protein H2248_008177 [Termitomyces sp. 'cryptogamus']